MSFIVKKEDLIGDLAKCPLSVAIKMVERQVEQGNKPDIKVFQNKFSAGKLNGGFDWSETKEGYAFWCDICEKDKKELEAWFPDNVATKEHTVYKTHLLDIGGVKREITFCAFFDKLTPRVGYSVLHPNDVELKAKPNFQEISKRIAKGRAESDKTNLLPEGVTISKELHSKQLLLCLIDRVKWQLEKGKLIIKGVR